MDSIERMGKTVEEAVSEVLKELGTTKDKVEIEVLEEGSKGFFGLFGSKMAKIRVTKKIDPIGSAKNFLQEIFRTMNMEVMIDVSLKDQKHMLIQLSGKDMGVLIGKRGQTLDSLQYLVNLVVNRGEASYISVTLDTENYRQRRKETLESLAFNLAKKAKQTKKSVVLEPMNPYERRIIHAALQNDRFVKTHSEGEEPYRNVVITPK
jgi:spoIIIJ-associated protein